MRLAPIEKPRGLLMRLAYWLSRRELGKVMSSLSVIYARSPAVAWPGLWIVRAMESKLALEPELKLLITTQSSMLNGCTFCADLHMAQAIQKRIGLEKFKALPECATSPLFSERERAVLTYTSEVTRNREASDAVFERLRQQCSEQEIIEITWLNAIGNFFNLMAVPLQLESDDFTGRALRRAESRTARAA